jgi:dUTP pyrophosphatase
MLQLKIKKWRSDSVLPKIAKSGDAGADCMIDIFKKINNENNAKELIDLDIKEWVLKPLERIACGLGFCTEIPEGYYAAVVPRSGLAMWNGISLVNTPGTIDAGYRNEWTAIVVNLSNQDVVLKKGERICQFILRKIDSYEMIEVDNLSESDRGLGGFGSTGK